MPSGTSCGRISLNVAEEMNMSLRILPRIAVPVALLIGLSACGSSPGERAITGAGFGAAAGAAAGALLGNPALGAAAGGLAGGAIGGLTTPSAIDLGRPAWRRD
jgi:osmotically inducible lipoprotein OsmB